VGAVFWAWIIVAIVCALAESVSGGGHVLPWAFGAGLAAAFEAGHLSMTWQWSAFFGASALISIVTQRLTRRNRK